MKCYLVFTLLFLGSCYHKDDSRNILYVDAVFKVDVPAPTSDKPQSKIWYSNGVWHTILPTSSGPTLWQRELDGWVKNDRISDLLQDRPGKADVFHQDGVVMAVLVGDCELQIIDLTLEKPSIVSIPIPDNCSAIETATITQDNSGVWWVAADMNTSILVWGSSNGIDWEEPYLLADDVNEDDICVIAKLPEHISVIWSNQNNQSIFESIHYDKDSLKVWSNPITVQQGNYNADDHLNTTLLENGTLMVISKNSLDKIDSPQFVLRARQTSGIWNNFPIIDLTTKEMPTRPVITRSSSGEIITAYAVKNVEPKDFHISIAQIKKQSDSWLAIEKLKIKARKDSKVNNVTVSKEPLPENAPWIILFSDDQGFVYEFDLKEVQTLF